MTVHKSYLRRAAPLVAFLAATSSSTGIFASESPSRLSKSDRSILAQSRVSGFKHVVVVIASQSGANAKVAKSLASIGGVVRYREDDVDYISATVPIEQVERFAEWPTIAAIDLDAPILRTLSESPTEGAVSSKDAGSDQERLPRASSATGLDASKVKAASRPRFETPGSQTPKENAFLATKDVGVTKFIAANPTFDGRGVTIAIIDTAVDPSVPELQLATTLDGRPTRKIVDWLTATDPLDDDLPIVESQGRRQSLWIPMQNEVVAVDREITYRDVTYRVPASGRFRIGLLDERAPNSVLAGVLTSDINRDGNPPGSSGIFGVLWSESRGEVWVDTDQDRDFADEKAMQEYRLRFDVATFGKDDPATAVSEKNPFVVQIDRARKFVYVGLTVRGHGTMIAGTAAGRGYFGAFDGVAPGAQLISISNNDDQSNFFTHTVIEGAIMAAKDPRVDLVSYSIGIWSALNDGTLVFEIVLDRLIERYGKPIFESVGNSGPGMNTARGASKAFGIGIYVGRDSWLANLGAHVENADYITVNSARGPTESGAMKPEFLAPSYSLTTGQAIYPGRTFTGHIRLPPGYLIGGGTSQATPFAAGVGALLISAAKQERVPYDVDRLRVALMNGARYLRDYGAHEQGSGLLQVTEAWKVLKSLRNESPPIFVSRAPVKTSLSRLLQTPGEGLGIFEREGWMVGDRGIRTVTLTRLSGPAAPTEYRLRLLGDSGTFSCPDSVVLALRVPTEVRIRIAPEAPGGHSAIFQVIDKNSLVVHQVLNTIVAAEELSPGNGYRVSSEVSVPRPGSTSRFISVPPGASVLSLQVSVSRGPLTVRVQRPNGQSDAETFRMNDVPTEYVLDGTWTRAFERPTPGVWEIVLISARDMSVLDESHPVPLPPAHSMLTVSILGVELMPVASDATVVVARNRFAAFEGRVVGSPLAAIRVQRVQFDREHRQQIYEILVLPGTERLSADVGPPSDADADADADVDLYLFDCTGAIPKLRAWSNEPGATERAVVHRPAPGLWKVALDAFRSNSDSVVVDYRDSVANAAFGRTEVTDIGSRREASATWQASVEQILGRSPTLPPTYALVGYAEVVADDVKEISSFPYVPETGIYSEVPVRKSVRAVNPRIPVALGRAEFVVRDPATPEGQRP